jgi:CRP/FNR family cyclic AMP-dependent transcriptional regulator
MSDEGSAAVELGTGWFGAGLSPHAVSALVACAALRDYPTDGVLMREGDERHPFGIVKSGRVALRLLVPERGTVTILTVDPGDLVGWSALVPPYRATSTAVAVEPTTLIEFDVPALRRALRKDPALAATVFPRVLESMARRLGATRHQLLDLYAHQADLVPW